MANLPETPQWDDGIYQIEVSDPVLGGPDGITNRPLKQLASRTLYLKQKTEEGSSSLAAHIAAVDPHTQYAPKISPVLTGTPTAPTAPQTTNNQQLATTAFVKAALAALVASSPAALDTLNELAAALGNDPNFATTMTNALANKQPLDNTLTALSGKTISGLLEYLGLGTAATKDVGTGENQIPDMSSFGSGSGWSQLPNGKLLQWGTYTGSAITGTINFPVPFPSSVGRVIMSLSGTSADAGSIAYVVHDDNSLSKTSFFFRRAGAQVRFNWFCIGE